ncbi:UDP-N-acetylmuramoyl-L-alanine--D-glutamate ligase [Agaribacterium haliotis]|uniref:UDP-N-acetylmuramoyl-L-alanine--D-glutamate ligase n=1 Tax=Agaribacterium haliotis TaxID=2013869 RepID=UPI000BB54F80|nr:UDP-N-acetylmuramoyl-L-alanine--D-glutamate ligase [Agaribacterium haliotis]
MLIASNQVHLIVGGGATGLSAARFLHKQQKAFVVFDTRSEPAIFEPFKALDADVRCYNSELAPALWQQISRVILSPGVSRDEAVIVEALARGIEVLGDVALFLEHVDKPVIGITGSNGKSTVTTMVGLAAQCAGLKVAVGGNLGRPALDLLADEAELYVLELSSFQLESTDRANLTVAAMLNVSADHLDRHGNLMNYFAIKQKIFYGAKNVVYKLDDALTQPPVLTAQPRYGFAIDKKAEQGEQQYYLNTNSAELYCDEQRLIARADIKVKGLHNIENLLAAFAICDAAEIPRSAVSAMAREFGGLPHRCEVVAEGSRGCFIDDSKATNEGACIAALKGLAPEFEQVRLIAGGLAKGASFELLAPVLTQCVSRLVLIGEDAPLIEAKVAGLDCLHAQTMEQAVLLAAEGAGEQDLVLLSPACASFDMFKGFEHRGQSFAAAVDKLYSEAAAQ